jgi:CRP-like cAMP-binding protein
MYQEGRSQNRLLNLLPEADFAHLARHMESVRVPLHEVVGEPGEPVRYANFPTTCVFSAIVQLRDGSAAEAATVGREGMVGMALIADERASVYRVVQEVEGESLRIGAEHFRAALAASEPLRQIVQRYGLTLTHQTGQNAACNLRHGVEQRMCRWLLMTQDRVGSDSFFLTQEDLANMLGVRRQSVSDVAGPLQDAGLIGYSRGNITILDRAGLEAASCECYRAIRETYERVMGGAG